MRRAALERHASNRTHKERSNTLIEYRIFRNPESFFRSDALTVRSGKSSS